MIDGVKVEQVDSFRYLGSLISADGYCEMEIHSRIKMAKRIFLDKKNIMDANAISGNKKLHK